MTNQETLMTTMTEREASLRAQLARRVQSVRSVLNRFPEPDFIDAVGTNEAAALLVEANQEVVAAKSLAAELDQLEAATSEAVLLAANATLALAMIHEMLAVLCADMDSRLAA